MFKNRVSISGHITEIYLHRICTYLSIKLFLFFVRRQRQTLKIASFLGVRGFLGGKDQHKMHSQVMLDKDNQGMLNS